jgi:hypothetical protein
MGCCCSGSDHRGIDLYLTEKYHIRLHWRCFLSSLCPPWPTHSPILVLTVFDPALSDPPCIQRASEPPQCHETPKVTHHFYQLLYLPHLRSFQLICHIGDLRHAWFEYCNFDPVYVSDEPDVIITKSGPGRLLSH